MIFTGSGSTAAIDKLIGILGLRIPASLDDRYHLRRRASRREERPVVFIGPFEHHSNELPWRESIADVVTIPEDADGHIDQARLRAELRAVRRATAARSAPSRPPPTSPASCPTPTAIASLLHEHGALSFWDFAACAPYVDIEMLAPARRTPRRRTRTRSSSPRTSSSAARARRACWWCAGSCSPTGCPVVPGGGTVMYVNPSEHRYLDDPAHREEGGTPAIVESIRAGLVFQLKQAVGVDTIQAPRGASCCAGRVAAWQAEPTIQILGNLDGAPALDRVVRGARADRGSTSTTTSWSPCSTTSSASRPGAAAPAPDPTATGCSASTWSARTGSRREIATGCEGIKPGWVRVNFNYFVDEEVVRLPRRGGRDGGAATAGGCCRTTASTRSRACGTTGGGRSSRRCGSPTWAMPPTAR